MSERAAGAGEGRAELARVLGTGSAVAVVVGTIIGSGIFGVPAPIAAGVGSVGAVLLLWVLGGGIALCGALSLAELAAAYPEPGGIYVYLREIFGPLVAFLFGWSFLVFEPASYAAVALIFARALGTIFPALAPWPRWVAAASLLGLVAVNVRSLRFGAALQNASTAAKVLVLIGLAVVAFVLSPGTSGSLTPLSVRPDSWPGFGIALISVMFAYDGWQWLPQLAGEMRDPERSLPRALLLGVLLVAAVYLLTNVANFWVLSLPEVAGSKMVTADVAGRLLGRAGAAVVAALVMVSTLSSNNGGFMTDPRVFFAMAEDGLFFRTVSRVHPRWRTPHVAVMLLGAVSILYLPFRDFEQLLEILILGLWPFAALAVLGLMRQRRRRPELRRPYRVPGYPVVPVFFLLAFAGMVANALAEHPISTLANFVFIAAGVPVFYGWRSLTEGRAGRPSRGYDV